MKQEAIKDCNQYIRSYTFTDTEYQTSPIRIRINALAGAPQGQLVRCNFLFAIKTLAIQQVTLALSYGATFTEKYRGRLLYSGTFDIIIDVLALEQSGNSSADPSETVVEEKRALSAQSLDATNSSTAFFTIPGSNDVEYEVEFDFRGSLISVILMFSVIIEFMMTLAQRESDDTVGHISQVTSGDPLWIFVMWNVGSRYALHVFEIVALLESVARYSVLQTRYQEMTFNLLIDGEVIARGCLTMPIMSRMWCQGL